MTAFDHDGVAGDYAAIPIELLAPKPRALSHVEAAAVPLAARFTSISNVLMLSSA